MNLPVRRRVLLSLLLSIAAVVAPAAAAAAPRGNLPYAYRSTVLDIPGANIAVAQDINDDGQAVGFYSTGSVFTAFVWDASGVHDLAVPAGSSARAFSINNAGEIVGSAQSATTFYLLRWNAATPQSFDVLAEGDALLHFPNRIGEDGTVVGFSAALPDGVPVHASVWTAAAGVVDYGSTDTPNPAVAGVLTASNADGRLVGHWASDPDQLSQTHAALGQLGTPGLQPFSAATDAVVSSIAAINTAGEMVGFADLADNGQIQPVRFNDDGSTTPLTGATLGEAAGQARDINEHGDIVGTALGAASNRIFLHADGHAVDVLALADGIGGLTVTDTFAINNGGEILGQAIVLPPAFAIRAFRLQPLFDAIFADAFDNGQ